MIVHIKEQISQQEDEMLTLKHELGSKIYKVNNQEEMYKILKVRNKRLMEFKGEYVGIMNSKDREIEELKIDNSDLIS